MARVLAPLLSLDASGTIGGAMTNRNWRGVNTVGVKSNPANPQSQGQMESRSYFSAGGKVTKAMDLEGDIVTQLRDAAPSGQSYASYYVREILGTGNQNIKDAISDHESNETEAGHFDTAAQAAGVEGVNLGHDDAVEISNGEILWAAYAASFRLGHAEAQTAPDSVSESDVETFTTALTGHSF